MQKNIKCKTIKHHQSLNRIRKQNKLHTNVYGFLKCAHTSSITPSIQKDTADGGDRSFISEE